MKSTFTRLGIIAFIFSFSVQSQAQLANALFLDAPADVAGVYPAYQPTPIIGDSIFEFTETAAFVIDAFGNTSDGCDAPIENVQDKVAFLDRSGNCEMSEAVVVAQNSGAVVAVICNNDPARGISNLPNEPEDVLAQVKIPIFGMSFADCAKLKLSIGSDDFTARFGYYCESTPDPDVLWGNEPGQGDFSNGLGDWTVVSDGDTSWYHTTDPIVPGAYSAFRYVVEGTACNGYMLFPSDFYDNDNQTGVGGIGLCPNNGVNANFCSGSLISPVIDLSGQNVEGLYCRFYHDWGYYYAGSTSLVASYDGGVTWPDTTYITLGENAGINNPEVSITGPCEVSTASVNDRGEGIYETPLLGYNGEPTVQLQFRHLGGYYHATIDDVVLISKENVDIDVDRGFVGRAPAERMPASQANAMPFHVDILNKGNILARDVEVKVDVTAPDGSLDFSTSNDTYADQPPQCFLNENNTFTDTYTPSQLGIHRALYSNITPGDTEAGNDTISVAFELTERTWAPVERGDRDEDGFYRQMYSGLLSNDPTDANFIGYDWAMAYTFYIPKGEGHYLNSVRFGINDRATNTGDVKVYLYLWNPEEGESFDPNRGQPGEVGRGSYTIPASDRVILGCMAEDVFGNITNGQAVSAPLAAQMDQTDITVKMGVADPDFGTPRLDSDGNIIPLELQDDQMYALVFVMNPLTDEKLEFIARASGDGSRYNQSATNLALDNLGMIQRYGASTVGLDNNGDFADEIQSLTFPGYFFSNQPWIEMDIATEPSNTEEITSEAKNSVHVYPNPTSNLINIALEMPERSATVTFDLVNIQGKLVKTMTENDIKAGHFVMPVNEIPSGLYHLNIRTELGFTSKKVVINK